MATRNVWKVIPGSWHAWIQNGEIESNRDPCPVHYLELADGGQFIGSWDHKPTNEELAEAVEVVTNNG